MTRQTFQKTITEEDAYIEILDTNKELRKELANEIANNDSREKRLLLLIRN